MTAFGLNAAGKKVAGRSITWTTSNSAIVTVDAGGFAKAIAVGTAAITATIDGFTATAPVTVAANEFVPTFTVNGAVLGYTPVSGADSASATGVKVPGATVQTYKIMTATFDSLATPELVNTTTTDAAGTFVVHDLPSAYYSIKVTPPASSPYAPGASFVGPQRIPQAAVTVRLSPKQ